VPRTIKCPYCGAEFTAPEGFSYVVCPYCGTTIALDTGERREAYLYPARLEEQEAYQLAIMRASQLPGAPRDIEAVAAYKSSILHYVPLYICRAKALVEGCSEASEEREEAFLAAPRAVPGLSDDYRFPAAGREPYDPERALRGVFHQVARSHEEPCRRLGERLRSRVLREARLARCSGEPVASTELIGIAHYPVWLVKYQYGDSTYRALVDAVDANVLYLEYPIPLERRALLLGGAAITLGTSIALSLAAVAATSSPLYLASWIPGAAAAAPFLTRVVSRIGRYMMRRSRVEDTVIEPAEK